MQVGNQKIIDEDEKLVGRALHRSDRWAWILLRELGIALNGGIIGLAWALGKDTIDTKREINSVLRRRCFMMGSLGQAWSAWQIMVILDRVSLAKAFLIFPPDKELPGDNLVC